MKILQLSAVSPGEPSLLGIDTSKRPMPSSFPRNFGTEGFPLWKEILESSWWKEIPKETSLQDQWYQLIQRYLTLCRKNGIYPFSKVSEATTNETIVSFLSAARNTAVSFADRIGLFDRCRVSSIKRKFIFERHSFVVETSAVLKSFDEGFTSWLTTPNSPGFKSIDGRLHKLLRANVEFFVDVGSVETVITLRIFCHTPVMIPDHGRLPSRAKLAAYAEKNLWLPAVRAFRFKGVGARLF